MLDDWRLGDDGQIDPNFITGHDLAHDGRWGQVLTVNGTTGRVLELRPGERVRLRLLNVANGRVFRPRFGPLEASVVAFDGRPTARPLAADTLELAPDNRADVELSAGVEARTIVVEDTFTRRRVPLASIKVDGAPAATSDREATPATLATPDWTDAVAMPPDETIRLQARRGGPYGVEWTLNDEVMRHAQHEHASVHPGAPRLRHDDDGEGRVMVRHTTRSGAGSVLAGLTEYFYKFGVIIWHFKELAGFCIVVKETQAERLIHPAGLIRSQQFHVCNKLFKKDNIHLQGLSWAGAKNNAVPWRCGQ